jgi:hypothetical protein
VTGGLLAASSATIQGTGLFTPSVDTTAGDLLIKSGGATAVTVSASSATVSGNLNVNAGSKIGVEGAAGDTYMQYNTGGGYLSIFVNNQEVARFRP